MLFSIIIPTYNLETFLLKQIKSIQKQTFTDFELIIVDDGSTDETEQKVLELNDDRIKYIYQENSGVSAARNNGMEKAKGEYILFVDADDICDSRMLEYVHKALIQDERKDIVYFGYTKIFSSNNKLPRTYKKSYEGKLTLDNIYRLEQNDMISVVYNKVIRRDIASKIKFQNTKIGEDYLYNLMLLKYVNSIKVIPEELYYYNASRENSAYKNYSSDRVENFEKQLEALLNVIDGFYNENLKEKIIDLKKMQSLSGIIMNLFRPNNTNSYLNNVRVLRDAKCEFGVSGRKIFSENAVDKKVKLKLLIAKLPSIFSYILLKWIYLLKDRKMPNK